jgi:hypothetical protein
LGLTNSRYVDEWVIVAIVPEDKKPQVFVCHVSDAYGTAASVRRDVTDEKFSVNNR